MEEETERKEIKRLLVTMGICVIISTITAITIARKQNEMSLKKAEAEIKLQEAKTEYYQKILEGEKKPWKTY